MPPPRIIERTLYDPLAVYLRSLSFQNVVTEARAGERDFSDLTFEINSTLFVVEVKIAKPTMTLGLRTMAQAARYARRYNTNNFIVLIFPEQYKNQQITNQEMLAKIAIESKVTCMVFSDYWTESLEGTSANIFTKLKEIVESGQRRIDFKTVVNEIKRFVIDLNSIVYYAKNEELVSEVVEKLDLFTAIGEVKDKETAKRQITNLSSYLLFNQLLFYHVYQRLSKDQKLAKLELSEISKVSDIYEYFNAIRDIDYKSIYKTDILAHIPDNEEVVKILNDVIGSIKLLRAEYVTHDLAGRFFHDLIPHEVRKILAAFYTHPNSAELLADLTIESWNNTIMDPACGSGTLLVSSYQNKLRKYTKQNGNSEIKRIHKEFLEKEITGIDIMPFASHITTINLAMQDIEQKTNIVRVASMDSLGIANLLKMKAFTKEQGIKISGFEKSIQKTLIGAEIIKKKQGSVSMEGKGAEFYLTPVDTIIMNPPFSDREKMPKDMRDKINENETLNKICGGQVNLWGLFLALSDLLLKDGGKVGAVLPINLARGEASKQVRHYLLHNYTTSYIIKPLEDKAFSEGASFKDILYIAIKRNPQKTDYTGIVSIKQSIKNLKLEQIQQIASDLKTSFESAKDKENSDFEIKFVKTLDLLKYEDNLMPIIGFTSTKNKEILESFLAKVREKAGDHITKIPESIIAEGFHASPSGMSEVVFITKPVEEARIERAFLIVGREEKGNLLVKLKAGDVSLEIPYSKLKPALRTLTGVKTFNPEHVDFIITQEPDGFEIIKKLSKWKGVFDWASHAKNVNKKESFVVVGRRFRPNSAHTHHFAFFSRTKLVSPDTFKMINYVDQEEAKIQTLFLNCSITIANILTYREQTTGGFTDIRESELISFDMLNFKKLTEKQKSTLKALFDKLKDNEFASITDQYLKGEKERFLLDSTILEVLGFETEEIKKVLEKLYSAINEELQSKG